MFLKHKQFPHISFSMIKHQKTGFSKCVGCRTFHAYLLHLHTHTNAHTRTRIRVYPLLSFSLCLCVWDFTFRNKKEKGKKFIHLKYTKSIRDGGGSARNIFRLLCKDVCGLFFSL